MGKPTGNHGFYHQLWEVPGNSPIIQFCDMGIIGKNMENTWDKDWNIWKHMEETTGNIYYDTYGKKKLGNISEGMEELSHTGSVCVPAI